MNAFQFFVVAVADVRLHFRHSTTVKRFDCFDGKDDGGERRRLAMATTMERDELYLRVHMSIELRNLIFFFSLSSSFCHGRWSWSACARFCAVKLCASCVSYQYSMRFHYFIYVYFIFLLWFSVWFRRNHLTK